MNSYINCVYNFSIFVFFLPLQILDEKIMYTRHEVDLHENDKLNRTLSSMCLLVGRMKFQRQLISDITEDDINNYSTLTRKPKSDYYYKQSPFFFLLPFVLPPHNCNQFFIHQILCLRSFLIVPPLLISEAFQSHASC